MKSEGSEGPKPLNREKSLRKRFAKKWKQPEKGKDGLYHIGKFKMGENAKRMIFWEPKCE